MPSLTHLLQLVLRGPGRRGVWAQPPSPRERGAENIVEVSRGGLCIAIRWQPDRYRHDGSLTYHLSVTRWYRDRAGAWRTTPSLQADDLPKVAAMVDECRAQLP